MYTNDNLSPIHENQQYIGLDGTQYPANFPKSDIPNIYPVVTVADPTSATVIATGYTIVKTTNLGVDTYTQTWQSRAKTQGEIDTEVADARVIKNESLYGSYLAARSEDIEFTTAGATTKDFQADQESIFAIQGMLDTYPVSTPVGFYWKATDNTKVTPFTRADLAGLANAIGDRAWGHFQNLTDKKEDVDAATTVAAVNAITW